MAHEVPQHLVALGPERDLAVNVEGDVIRSDGTTVLGLDTDIADAMVLSRLFSAMGARRRARSADRRLRAAIAEVTEELVIEPIETEIEAYRRARDGLAAALR